MDIAVSPEIPAIVEFIQPGVTFPPQLSPDGRHVAWYRDMALEIEPAGPAIEGDVSAWVPMSWVSDRALVLFGGHGWGVLDVQQGAIVPLPGVRTAQRVRADAIALLGAPSDATRGQLEGLGLEIHTLDAPSATGLLVDEGGIAGAYRRTGRASLTRADGSLPAATQIWRRSKSGLRPVARRYAQWPTVGDFRILPRLWAGSILALDGQTRPFTSAVKIALESGETDDVAAVPERGAVAAVLQAPATGEPLAYAVRDERLTWKPISERIVRDLAFLSARIPDDDWAPVSVSDDLSTWLIQSVSPTHFGRYWRYSRATASLSRIDSNRHETVTFRSSSTLTWSAPDGQTVGAYVTTPDSTHWGQGPWPLVVLAHGSPWLDRYWWGYNFTAQRLAALGIASVAVNYRSSDGYGTRFSKTPGDDDLADAIEQLTASGVADRDRVALIGISYGGILTIRTAARHPGLMRCGVAISAAESWPAHAGAPPPMLLLAGGRDDIVSVERSARTASRLVAMGASGPAAGPTGGHSFVIFPAEGHSLPTAQAAGWAMIEHFLGACLGRPSGPWGTMLDGHEIEPEIAGMPGLFEAIKARNVSGKRFPPLPLLDSGPIMPFPLWAPL